MAPSFYERCDDSNGAIGSVMEDALEDLGRLAPQGGPKASVLADKVYAGVCANGYGQFDGLIGLMTPILGKEGLALLKPKFEALEQTPPTQPKDDDRRVIGRGRGGPLYEDYLEIKRHVRLWAQRARQPIVPSAIADRPERKWECARTKSLAFVSGRQGWPRREPPDR